MNFQRVPTFFMLFILTMSKQISKPHVLKDVQRSKPHGIFEVPDLRDDLQRVAAPAEVTVWEAPVNRTERTGRTVRLDKELLF